VRDVNETPPAERPSRTRTAALLSVRAGRSRKYAAEGGSSAPNDLAEAELLECEAAELLKPPQPPLIRSGEVARSADEFSPPWELRKTLVNPGQVAIDASTMRTELIFDQPGDVVALALDTAESLQAETSPEKMLAHQLAVLHVLAMKAAKRALEFDKPDSSTYGQYTPAQSVEFARQCNSFARLSSAFQDGLIANQTIRRGARQTVRVEHVTIAAGAQAVIGNVTTRGKRPNKRRGRGEK
jgi:hypothetical protein